MNVLLLATDFASLLTVAALVFIFLSRDPGTILKAAFCSSLLSIFIFWGRGAETGLFMAQAVSSAQGIQILLRTRATLPWRLAAAAPFVVLAWLHREPGILPLLVMSVFISMRLLEAYGKELPLKLGYLYGTSIWAVYYMENGLSMMLVNSAFCLILNLSGLWAIWRGVDPLDRMQAILRERLGAKARSAP